ncbi:MAG: hypothetical protein KAH93_02190 [Candidatus Aenigmarchaeota archaeon]|nr:hypothetical protein [Candidatus Aenigmarchaeota archaeon]
MKDCKICHEDSISLALSHYDRHSSTQKKGGKCSSCHNLNAGAGAAVGSGNAGPGGPGLSTAVHPVEVTGSCSDCHTGNQVGQGEQAAGNQYWRGR